MNMHAHIHIKHDNFNCKWPLPLGESLGIPYDVIHMCMCTCVGALNQDNSILFEDF